MANTMNRNITSGAGSNLNMSADQVLNLFAGGGATFGQISTTDVGGSGFPGGAWNVVSGGQVFLAGVIDVGGSTYNSVVGVVDPISGESFGTFAQATQIGMNYNVPSTGFTTGVTVTTAHTMVVQIESRDAMAFRAGGGDSNEITIRNEGLLAGETTELMFQELNANGTDAIGFKAPDTILATVIWTLPDADATVANQALLSDSSGILSWGSPPAAASASIEDADSDTRILVEQAPDDDTIRMFVGDNSVGWNVGNEMIEVSATLIALRSASALGGSGNLGANIRLETGSGDGGSDGGNLNIITGAAGAAGGRGGNINITPGDTGGSGVGSIQLQPAGTGAGETTQLRFRELISGGANHVAFRAADSIAADVVWTLPDADSSLPGLALTSNGAGILSWSGVGILSDVDVDTAIFVEQLADEDVIRMNVGDNTSTYLGLTNVVTLGISTGFHITAPNAPSGSGLTGIPVSITAGDGDGGASGGDIDITAGGRVGGGGGLPGAVNITGGSNTSGGGNNVNIQGGDGSAAAGAAHVRLFGGSQALESNAAGSVRVHPGEGTGTNGGLELMPYASDSGTCEIRFRETIVNGFSYVGFQAPTAIPASQIWVLPDSDGTIGMPMVTDGVGNLTFADFRRSPATVDASVSGVYAIDWSLSDVFELTVVGNTTFSFSNVTPGRSITVLIKIDSTGGYTITLPSTNVLYESGVAFTVNTAANEETDIVYKTFGSATDIRSTLIGNNYA